jgi:hypothetical protein
MQIQDHGKIEPAFAGPDIGNVTSPFLVWSICVEVTIQQVGRDVELMIAIPLSADCVAIACRAMVVALCLRVLMTDMPFWRINRPTRRWPISRPISFNSSVMRGLP